MPRVYALGATREEAEAKARGAAKAYVESKPHRVHKLDAWRFVYFAPAAQDWAGKAE